MKTIVKRLAVFLIVISFVSATFLGASALGPGKGHGHGGGGNNGHENDGPTSVPEPAALALLGVGLVSLGLYTKRKKGSK